MAGTLGSVARPGGVSPAPRPAPKPAPAPEASAPDSVVFDSSATDSVGDPKLLLSWHAPYGMLGASDTLSFSGVQDSSAADTLYLSFEPGYNGRRFYGMYARIYFHPQFGETLGTYWRYGRGTWNGNNLAIEYDPDGTFPCAQPWARVGIGHLEYRFDPGGARLELFYLVSQGVDAVPVAGLGRYCFARVMFRQRQGHLPGARQPVCIEWSEAKYSVGGPELIVRRGPQRFVSINSPDGSVCAPYRGSVKPRPWVPGRDRTPGSPSSPPPATSPPPEKKPG
jgi:hypothetical protein